MELLHTFFGENLHNRLLSMTNARTSLSSRGCVGLTKDFRAEWNVCELSRLDWLWAERRCDEDSFHGKGRFQVLQSSENDNVIAKGIVRYSVWQRIGLSIFSTTETRYTWMYDFSLRVLCFDNGLFCIHTTFDCMVICVFMCGMYERHCAPIKSNSFLDNFARVLGIL